MFLAPSISSQLDINPEGTGHLFMNRRSRQGTFLSILVVPRAYLGKARKFGNIGKWKTMQQIDVTAGEIDPMYRRK